jgi:protein-L-isoaspartate(D-aspartate) O-methyltransferase
MIDFEHARTVMVDTQLRPANISDRKLLAAMGRIPREKFVPEARAAIAYVDIAQPLAQGGRQLASAVTFARLAQLAEISPDDFVLDIGCGTGYSTAILAELAGAVVGIDDDDALVEAANANLADLDIGNATILKSDLAGGVPSEAPFDVIVFEGAVGAVPEALLAQLRDGGRLVAMITEGATATATIFVKSGKDIAMRPTFNASMPPLAGLQTQASFAL